MADKVSQATDRVRAEERRKDALLTHCITRAVLHDHGGLDAAIEKYGPHGEGLSKWAALKAAARVTPKASRVAAFIVMWAVAMRDEAVDEYSITQYQHYWNEGERQAYRVQEEFRDLWPEFETPNELARQLVKHIDGQTSKRDIATLPSRLQVTV